MRGCLDQSVYDGEMSCAMNLDSLYGTKLQRWFQTEVLQKSTLNRNCFFIKSTHEDLVQEDGTMAKEGESTSNELETPGEDAGFLAASRLSLLIGEMLHHLGRWANVA
ncbi:hypothetical protein NDU88_005935 [Pleurodeles waltl]|uniref:Uncharacterized protein n=1 Tax=Pleurodeles waltl TaxID=8319 RepID=A0AAV7TBV8_PLEWA|nr:hypothetical protein NDU88_005935 [Pleurodeles waltl]